MPYRWWTNIPITFHTQRDGVLHHLWLLFFKHLLIYILLVLYALPQCINVYSGAVVVADWCKFSRSRLRLLWYSSQQFKRYTDESARSRLVFVMVAKLKQYVCVFKEKKTIKINKNNFATTGAPIIILCYVIIIYKVETMLI